MNRNLALLQVVVYLVCGLSTNAQQATRQIQLQDAVSSGLFYPKMISGIRSMNDGEYYTTLNGGKQIIKYNYATGLPAGVMFSLSPPMNAPFEYFTDYEFNSDETKILLTTDVDHIYRHSFTASYYVFDIKTGSLKALSQNGKQQLASFSPTANKVAFMRDNNLFITDLDLGTETQITTDGKRNEIINGAPDWVYEEEFGFSKAYDWSPDGNSIAFMRFDESRVKTFTIPLYDSLYPTLYTYKYPKAGEDNSLVTVWVYSLRTGKLTQMDVGSETDQYIPRIKWTPITGKLCILRLNRMQNHIDVLLDDTSSGTSEIIFKESNDYFISEVDDQYITFTNNGKYFIIFSEREGFKHLYRYTTEGIYVNKVTQGDFDVTELLAFDQKSEKLYFTSTEGSSTDRAVYSVNINGMGKTRLTDGDGTYTVEFSTTFKYYILTRSDANTPPEFQLYNSKNKMERVLEDNKLLRSRIQEYGFAKKELLQIPNADGTMLNTWMIKPANFDPSKKYPLFMFVYGGPESQEVTNSWDLGMVWFQMLAQKGYIVACVDNRGTDGRGEKFRKCTYMQLGKLETEDQISSAKYFGSLPYIDASRIGIFGWSYGGYMSSLCMTKGADVFKVGIAVAPVTNWRYYDNIYTERFMRKPQDNPSGYDDNSPINFANLLKGKFLLVHGSADDNVHLQNTMMFAEKLVQANKDFTMAIYTNRNHGIRGGNTRLHLYTKMTNFILDNL